MGWAIRLFPASVPRAPQVGNAVPLGLGEALGRALLAASEDEPDEKLLGRFETFNLDWRLCPVGRQFSRNRRRA